MLKAKLQKLQVIVQKKCYNIHDREIIAIIYKKRPYESMGERQIACQKWTKDMSRQLRGKKCKWLVNM